MIVRGAAIACLCAVALGCGGEPKPAPPQGASPAAAVMAPDTMMKRLDSTRRADSIAGKTPRTPKAPPPNSRLRDSAFGPKFELDSNGKVRPVSPPKRP